jgi:CO/xanthine dehydrogenase FAD-binding subunit
MRSFAFHRPTHFYECRRCLAAFDDSIPLAGGMTLAADHQAAAGGARRR